MRRPVGGARRSAAADDGPSRSSDCARSMRRLTEVGGVRGSDPCCTYPRCITGTWLGALNPKIGCNMAGVV
eukprot:scaffold12229_cov32-Tisochrysis_lutea.AAC.2